MKEINLSYTEGEFKTCRAFTGVVPATLSVAFSSHNAWAKLNCAAAALPIPAVPQARKRESYFTFNQPAKEPQSNSQAGTINNADTFALKRGSCPGSSRNVENVHFVVKAFQKSFGHACNQTPLSGLLAIAP